MLRIQTAVSEFNERISERDRFVKQQSIRSGNAVISVHRSLESIDSIIALRYVQLPSIIWQDVNIVLNYTLTPNNLNIVTYPPTANMTVVLPKPSLWNSA